MSPFFGACHLLAMFAVFLLTVAGGALLSQSVPAGVSKPANQPAQNVGACKPVSQRTLEVGCWILADDPIGQVPTSSMFWHLDRYPTPAAAETDRGPRGTVVESLGKVWLLTIEDENWRPQHGNRVATIGPLAIIAGEKYSTQYLEAIFTPGMTVPSHTHSGPEVWYTEAGETCLETSDGHVQIGRPGGPPVIVPTGLPMHLTATGTEQRRSLVLILYETSKPPTTMVHDWVPQGLCKHPDVR
jgi:quercetin dioxygenase-like cupin family protein